MQQPAGNPNPTQGSADIAHQPSDGAAGATLETTGADGDSEPINLASHQPDSQAKEVLVIVVLGVLREVMSFLASALKTPPGQVDAALKNWLYWLAHETRPAMTIGYLSLVSFMVIMLLNKRRIPRRFLDGVGVLIIFSLLVQFAKINLLLMTPSGPPAVVLAQVIVFILYFAFAWGWIFWRLDAATKTTIQTEIALDEAELPITMFDYYHLSMLSIIRRGGRPPLRGVSKLGRIITTVHNLMMLDLYGVVLGRFYQLVQKTI